MDLVLFEDAMSHICKVAHKYPALNIEVAFLTKSFEFQIELWLILGEKRRLEHFWLGLPLHPCPETELKTFIQFEIFDVLKLN